MMGKVQSTGRYTRGASSLILRWGKLPSVMDTKQRPETLGEVSSLKKE